MKTVLSLLFLFLMVISSGAKLINKGPSADKSAKNTARNAAKYRIISPYAKVNWNKINQIKTSLHCHTLNANAPIGEWSDGNTTSPAQLLAKYKELGYGAVAITDHDYVTYPWSKFEVTDNSMIAIPGSELSKHTADMLSYGTDYHDKKGEGRKVSNGFFGNIKNITAMGGIMYLAHPARSKNLSKSFWYNLLKGYPNIKGMEVLNAGQFTNNHSEEVWDYILTRLAPERMIWGSSTDDAHSVNMTGTGWTNLLLSDNEMNTQGAMEALKNGNSYFSTFRVILEVDDKKPRPAVAAPKIISITTNETKGTIMIVSDNTQLVEWISADGIIVASGNKINVNKTQNVDKYVRARIKGEGGQTLTQPFALIRAHDQEH